MPDCCNEFSRASLLRAAAGRGLPAIEPGMPTPAGTGLTRRAFVARSAGLALAARGTARRGEGDRAAVDRLRPSRPVALHLAPLLGGRRDRPAPAHGLDGPLPRPRRLAGQPAPGPVARRAAAADARDREGAGSRA